MTDAPLLMVQCSLNARELARWAARNDLPTGDEGYLVHYALRKALGEAAPQPFAVEARKRRGALDAELTVYGYGQSDKATLASARAMYADPELAEALDVESILVKEMPVNWPVGHLLGFKARCCPVARSREPKPDGGTRVVERDAYLHAALKAGPDAGLAREEVYLDWLAGELARDGAAELVSGRLVSFQLHAPVRKRKDQTQASHIPAKRTEGGKPKYRYAHRPDASLAGTLRIRDAAAFPALLARGLGRHRAFGFGMLLLRPAPPTGE